MILIGLALVILYLFPDFPDILLLVGLWLMVIGIIRAYMQLAQRRQVRRG